MRRRIRAALPWVMILAVTACASSRPYPSTAPDIHLIRHVIMQENRNLLADFDFTQTARLPLLLPVYPPGGPASRRP